MLEEYYIVAKEVLPEVFDKVIQVKDLLSERQIKVSDATKTVGISRSTYYKYKDFVFKTQDNAMQRKALISFIVGDEKGKLSEVLNLIFSYGGNIITINQNIPINERASVVISMDVQELKVDISSLIEEIGNIKHVNKVRLISIE